MTGVEKIVEKILSDARAQAQEMTNMAQAEANALCERVKARAKEDASVIVAEAKNSMEERDRRIVSVAELEIRKRVLAAKREVLEEAYAQAAQVLTALDADAYRQRYLHIVRPAIQKGTEGIAPGPKDADRLGAAFVDMLNAALKAEGKTAQVVLLPVRENIEFGCIVCSGGMEIDFSTQAVMRVVRENTEGEVAKILFARQGE